MMGPHANYIIDVPLTPPPPPKKAIDTPHFHPALSKHQYIGDKQRYQDIPDKRRYYKI